MSFSDPVQSALFRCSLSHDGPELLAVSEYGLCHCPSLHYAHALLRVHQVGTQTAKQRNSVKKSERSNLQSTRWIKMTPSMFRLSRSCSIVHVGLYRRCPCKAQVPPDVEAAIRLSAARSAENAMEERESIMCALEKAANGLRARGDCRKWLENADPWRRQLFDRPPFDEGA